jgi:hypothetical protein
MMRSATRRQSYPWQWLADIGDLEVRPLLTYTPLVVPLPSVDDWAEVPESSGHAEYEREGHAQRCCC